MWAWETTIEVEKKCSSNQDAAFKMSQKNITKCLPAWTESLMIIACQPHQLLWDEIQAMTGLGITKITLLLNEHEWTWTLPPKSQASLSVWVWVWACVCVCVCKNALGMSGTITFQSSSFPQLWHRESRSRMPTARHYLSSLQYISLPQAEQDL